jgi:hypothetical protein
VRVREQKRFREEGEPRLFCFSPSLFLMCCFSCPIAERETPSFPRETNSLLSCHEGLLAFAHSHSTHILTPIHTLTQTNTLTHSFTKTLAHSLIHKDTHSPTHTPTLTRIYTLSHTSPCCSFFHRSLLQWESNTVTYTRRTAARHYAQFCFRSERSHLVGHEIMLCLISGKTLIFLDLVLPFTL